MNVLYVSASSEIGGAENSLLLLLKHIDKESFHPILVLPSNGPLAERMMDLGIETFVVPLNALKARNPLPYLLTVWCLMSLIRRKKISIVHCNVPICNQYALPAARLNGIANITHMRTAIFGKRAFSRMFLPWADALVAISNAVRASFARYAKGQQVVVIPNGIELSKFSPVAEGKDTWRQTLPLSSDTYTIGLLGRIIRQKGHHVAISALAEIVSTYPDVCLLIVGGSQTGDHPEWFEDTGYMNDLKALIEELGLTEKVFFTGFIQNVIPVIASLDVMVIPSLLEACGRTALEAMAMGKPVIASDAGPAREVVDDGRTAFLVPPNDSHELAAAILRLIKNKALAMELGEKGRKKAEQCFSIEQHVERIERLYRSIAGVSGIQSCCVERSSKA